MDKMKIAADLVRSGEITYIDYVSEISAAEMDISEGRFRPWDVSYWKTVRRAHSDGKKVVFVSGPVPPEVLYAMDCIPFYVDFFPSRLLQNAYLSSWLIGETEKKVNPDLCRLNKIQIGSLLAGNMGVIPDAYISAPIPCDSARTAYFSMERLIKAPSFHFDIPICRNSRSLDYIEAQFGAFINFIERITDKKLDWESLRYRIDLSNKSAELLERCSLLRKVRPCPMSSHMNIWNELMNAFAPTEEMLSLLQKELEICRSRIETGESPCPDGEKHRLLLMHNMLWQGLDLMDWLESEYGAVTVMDGYSFRKREFFDHPDDRADCFKIMCRRMLYGSTAHGAGAFGDDILDAAYGVINDYSADVSIFLGSSGCRHEWASLKMLTDSIFDKFGIPTLIFDIDNADMNYKSDGEIKSAISQYMDTVINKN